MFRTDFRYLFLVVGLISFSAGFGTQALAAQPLRFCTMQLNATSEGPKIAKFLTSIADANHQYRVEEVHKRGVSPVTTLRNLVRSGKTCDVLMISGHHSGFFWGDQAGDPSLGVIDMARESCAFKDWFSKIKVVYLQGCRTLGASHIVDPAADAQRVLGDLGRGQDQGNNMNFGDHMRGFEMIYDPSNPLAKFYSAVFPKAKIFGYSWVAPSPPYSEQTIPDHIKNIRQKLAQRTGRTSTLGESFDFLLKAQESDDLKLVQSAWEAIGEPDNHENLISIPKHEGFASTIGNSFKGMLEHDVEAALNHRCAMLRSPIEDTWTPDSMASIYEIDKEVWTPEKSETLKEALTSTTDIELNFPLIRYFLDSNKSVVEAVTPLLRQSKTLGQFLENKLSDEKGFWVSKLGYYGVYADFFSGGKDHYLVPLMQVSLENLVTLDTVKNRDFKGEVLGDFPVKAPRERFLTQDQKNSIYDEFIDLKKDPSLYPGVDSALSKMNLDSSFNYKYFSALSTAIKDVNQNPDDPALRAKMDDLISTFKIFTGTDTSHNPQLLSGIITFGISLTPTVGYGRYAGETSLVLYLSADKIRLARYFDLAQAQKASNSIRQFFEEIVDWSMKLEDSIPGAALASLKGDPDRKNLVIQNLSLLGEQDAKLADAVKSVLGD